MKSFDKGNLETISFELQDDEYIIEIFGRKGLVLDALGFKTNLGKSCSLGGKGGGEFSFKAPKGFHYCIFSGCCGDCNASLSTLLADIKQIPSKENKPKMQIITQSILPILRNIIDFLSIEEFINLFLLNKTFANFRFDSFILKKLAFKMIYGLDTNQRKYIKTILVKMNLEDQIAQELQSLYQYTKNKIANSSGKDNFDEWNVSLNGGNGWAIGSASTRAGNKKCFASSFDWNELEYKKDLLEVLTPQQYQDFLNQKAIIAVGGFVGQNGFGGNAKMKLQLFDQQNKKICQKEIKKDNIPMDFALMRIYYLNPKNSNVKETQKDPSLLIFKIAGKDKVYWQGHYGANFTQIFIRLLPFNDEVKKFLPDQDIQDTQTSHDKMKELAKNLLMF